MVTQGDLTELINDDLQTKSEEIHDVSHVPWKFNNDDPIPIEIFSLYSVDTGTITINDIHENVFEGIKKSNFSYISSRIHVYEEMFILFFEFAIEKYPKEFEFVHFGLVPTSDFFTTLDANPIIKIRTKKFVLNKNTIKKVTDHLSEFKKKYPDSSFN